MDIALHPRFAENRYVYLTYTKPLDEKRRTVALARGRFDGRALTDVRDIFVTNAGGTSRIAFGRDGTLFMTTTGNNPQDPNTLGGKVLRLNDDGSVPADNPFVGRAGHKPEVYTLGHRSTARPGDASGHRRDVAERERSERRRRDQHPPARSQLRLAARELRAHVSGPVAVRAPHA